MLVLNNPPAKYVMRLRSRANSADDTAMFMLPRPPPPPPFPPGLTLTHLFPFELNLNVCSRCTSKAREEDAVRVYGYTVWWMTW